MSTGELKLIWSVWERWELNLFFLCSGSVASIRKVGGNHFLCACSSFPLPHIPLTRYFFVSVAGNNFKAKSFADPII